MGIPRIPPAEAKRRVQAGALLVCGYDSEERYRSHHLEGSISLQEFRSRAARLEKERPVIFYCA